MDHDLHILYNTASGQSDPIEHPSDDALRFLASLHLSHDDFDLLLGEAPGLSWTDIQENAAAFYGRLRTRVARLVCHDEDLKAAVHDAVGSGAEAVWLALVAAVGLSPEMIAAATLKPLAVGVVLSGVSSLCSG